MTESSKSLSFKLSSKLNADLEFKIHKRLFEITKLELPESDIKNGSAIKALMEVFKFCDKKNLDVILGDLEKESARLGLDKSIEGVRLIAALILAQPKTQTIITTAPDLNWPSLRR